MSRVRQHGCTLGGSRHSGRPHQLHSMEYGEYAVNQQTPRNRNHRVSRGKGLRKLKVVILDQIVLHTSFLQSSMWYSPVPPRHISDLNCLSGSTRTHIAAELNASSRSCPVDYTSIFSHIDHYWEPHGVGGKTAEISLPQSRVPDFTAGPSPPGSSFGGICSRRHANPQKRARAVSNQMGRVAI